MKTAFNILIISILYLNVQLASAQDDFIYKRKLHTTPNGQGWNYVTLPDDIYEQADNELADLRIYKFEGENKTEVPYLLLDYSKDDNKYTYSSFKIINATKDDKGYYFTLENKSNTEINSIKLEFENTNFYWYVDLDGSNDQNKWFRVLDDYKIMSIDNDEANYRYQNLSFDDTKYRYYRIFIEKNEKTAEKPALKHAYFYDTSNIKEKDRYKTIKIDNFEVDNDKKTKQTIINFSLKHKIAVHSVIINVKSDKKYNRYADIVTIDTTRVRRRKVESYYHFSSSEISSEKTNELIGYTNYLAKKFSITIENHDDEPLEIESIVVKIIPKSLVFESKGSGEYFLYYGNKELDYPTYDIRAFASEVHKKPKDTIAISEAIVLNEDAIAKKEPIIQNKLWLWVVMGSLIVILGYFSFKMLPKKE